MIIRGECLEEMKKMEENKFDGVVIDPPYNVGIADWDIIENYEKFCIDFINEAVRITKPNKAIWIFGNQHNISIMKNIMDKISLIKFRSKVIWNKGVGIPNNNSFSNKYEEILYYIKLPDEDVKKEFGKHIKERRLELNISLKEIGKLCNEKWYHRGGQLYFETGIAIPTVKQYKVLKNVLNIDDKWDIWFDNHFIFNLEAVGVKWKYENDKRNKRGWKNCGDVWDVPQLSGTFKERLDHPTQKPIKLIEIIIKVSSNEEDLILDLFAGTGTTSFVCNKLNRKFIAIEQEEKYIKIINERLAQTSLLQRSAK